MFAQPSLVDALAGTSLFESVPAEVLERVAPLCRRRSYRKGQIVFTAGDPSESLIMVVRGRVKVAARSPDGGDLTLTILQPGGCLGELGVVDGGPRSTDAEMIDDGELLLIPAGVVHDLGRRCPEVYARLMGSLATSLRRLTDATAGLVFLDVPRRVAKLLLAQPRSPGGEVDLALSQEQLAALVGATRQSVSGALHTFEKRGWIALSGGRVVLLRTDALEQFVG